MYWFPKRNPPVIVTWNFVKASKIRKKMWWRKWRLFWGWCCHTSTEANQQVSVERASLTIRKPAFQTHRDFFLESSRSFHHASCSPNQEWERSCSMAIKGNVLLSSRANRTNEIEWIFFLPKVWHLLGACLKCRFSGPTRVYWARICILGRSLRKPVCTYILKSSEWDCW